MKRLTSDTVGVPTTSQIVTGDSQKLSYSTRKSTLLDFLIRQIPSTLKPATPCSAKLIRQTRQSLRILKDFTFLKSKATPTKFFWKWIPLRYSNQILKHPSHPKNLMHSVNWLPFQRYFVKLIYYLVKVLISRNFFHKSQSDQKC